jgi:hypothetical protein
VHALANYISLSNREHLVLSFLKAELPCNPVRFYFAPVLPTFFFKRSPT